MFWVCRFCRIKNIGTHKFCNKCLAKRVYAELKGETNAE